MVDNLGDEWWIVVDAVDGMFVICTIFTTAFQPYMRTTASMKNAIHMITDVIKQT